MHQTIDPMIRSLSENNQISITFDQKYQTTIKNNQKSVKTIEKQQFPGAAAPGGRRQRRRLIVFQWLSLFFDVFFITFGQI